MDESRRSFFKKLIKGTLGVGVLASLWPYLRSLVPNVLYEPPKRFKVGLPEIFSQGVTFIDDRRIFIFREGTSFHCISAVCSHLGCTVKYSPHKKEKEMTVKGMTFRSKGEIHCPCHGSKFYDEGTNFAGPAPSPLPWYSLEIASEDGQLIVDMSKNVDRNFKLVV